MSEITYQEETSLNLGEATPEMEQAAAELSAAFGIGVEDQPAEAAQSPAPSAPAPTQETPAAAESAEPEFDLAMFDPQLTPELQELLEDEPPDFDAEARAEIQAQLQSAEDTGTYFDGDPEAAARLRALEKRNQFLEGRLVETNRGKWVQENLRAYPLVAQFAKDELGAIQATSRRGFARDAAALNERLAKMAKPLLEYQAKTLAKVAETVTVAERARVNEAWGTPAADLAATGAGAEALAKIAAAQRSGDLGKVIEEMANAGFKAF